MKIKRKIPVTLLSEGKVALRWNRKNKYAIGLVLSAAFPKDSLNMLGYKSTPIISDPKNHNEWDHARIWSGMKVYDASQFYIPESLYKEMTTKNIEHLMLSSRESRMSLYRNPTFPRLFDEIKSISNLAEAEEARKKVEGEYFTPVKPLQYTLKDVIDGKVAIENSNEDRHLLQKALVLCFPVFSSPFSGKSRYYLLDDKTAGWKATDDNPGIPSQSILEFDFPSDIQSYAHGMYEHRQAELNQIAKRTANRSKGKPVVEVDLKVQPDPVNHPPHYTSGKIEVIDFIEDQKLGMHLGNSVKYIARAGKKDPSKTVQDLEKAIWYIKRFITKYEKDNQVSDIPG